MKADVETVKPDSELIGLSNKCLFSAAHSAHRLGFVFDEHLTYSDQIAALSKHFIVFDVIALVKK